MTVWYNQIRPKVVHGLINVITEQRQKTLPLRKIRVCYFFRAVHHSKPDVIPHPRIAAILDVNLNILQR